MIKFTNFCFITHLEGSSTRICFVDGETVETAPKWRHTGDIGQLGPHGDLYIVGRENLLQIKRQGKRINLAQIDSVIRSLRNVVHEDKVLLI